MATTLGRLYRGCRLQDAHNVPSPLPPLTSLDSAFQLQEYIAILINADVHDIHRIVAIPTRRDEEPAYSSEDESNTSFTDEEKVADEQCWIYEHLRRVALDLSHPLLTALQQECNRNTCPEMKADEWLYLCVAHGTGSNGVIEQQCCAIDYIVHTLDSATALLNSPKAFPSRISIPSSSRRHFHSLARRLSRIFAHAYYHHREAFESCEAESSLYSRFYHLSRTFDLVPAEFLIPPPSPPTKSSSEFDDSSDDDHVFNRRDSSHSLPRPDASTLPSPKPSPGLQGQAEGPYIGSSSPGSLGRTGTMFLSSEPFEPRLQANHASWQKQSSNPDVGDDLSPIDDDSYDIVEGLSSQGLGEMIQGIEDDEELEPETNVVVDEMDGAGEGLPPVDSSHVYTEKEADELAHAVEEASKLPILHSGMSPSLSPKPDHVGFEVSSPRSPLRSPRRGTIRQSDVSPSLVSRGLPDVEDVALMSLSVESGSGSPAPASVRGISPNLDESHHAARIALPMESRPDELEEVDLSTGPTIVDEVEQPT